MRACTELLGDVPERALKGLPRRRAFDLIVLYRERLERDAGRDAMKKLGF